VHVWLNCVLLVILVCGIGDNVLIIVDATDTTARQAQELSQKLVDMTCVKF